MKTKPSKPASKQKPTAVQLKDLKPKRDPKAGLIATDGDPDGPLIP